MVVQRETCLVYRQAERRIDWATLCYIVSVVLCSSVDPEQSDNGKHGVGVCAGDVERRLGKAVRASEALESQRGRIDVHSRQRVGSVRVHLGRLRGAVGARIFAGQGVRTNFVYRHECDRQWPGEDLPVRGAQGQDQGQDIDARRMYCFVVPVHPSQRYVLCQFCRPRSIATSRQHTSCWHLQRGKLNSFRLLAG